MIQLREYQRKAVQSIFDYFDKKPNGNPCLVLPTGAGKSICIAAFINASLKFWDEIKIMILTHQKELIEQDARALKNVDPSLSIGIYAASLGCKDLSQRVTYASIQSIYKLTVPDVKLMLIDEAHLINNESKGMYRKFLDHNRCKVIGLTATPYRLGQGYITDGESIFTDLLEPTSILELQRLGYLAKLTSKGTLTKLDISKVSVKGGEYIEKELDEAVNTFETNQAVCEEIIKSAAYYKRHHILIFCSGIDHTMNIAMTLSEMGMNADYVTGKMNIVDREEKLYAFTHGSATAMCNANLLTTGFDYPDIDMIVMLRPTLSPGLYMQMAGRGLRLKSNGGDCLVLDFAGNVLRHGPIAFVKGPAKKKEGGKGIAPCKECPECLEIVMASTAVCPNCGHVFPKNSMTWILYDGDVNGDGLEKYEVTMWIWHISESRSNGTPMIVCDYRISNSVQIIRKFYTIWHERSGGYALKKLKADLKRAGIDNIDINTDFPLLMDQLNAIMPPKILIAKRSESNPKYREVKEILFEEDIKRIQEQAEKEKKEVENARARLYGA